MKRANIIGIAATLIAGGVIWYAFWSNSAEGGTPIAKVKVPALEGLALEGETLFNANCAECHGKNAAGQHNVAPPLVHVIYEPNHHSDSSFIRAAKNGAQAHHWPFGNMPPVKGVTDTELTRIITYIRALQRANGIF